MSATMAPLRAEHRDLLPHIEKLRAAAEASGTAPPKQVVSLVDECVLFLTHHLLPHAKAEEAALYPVVQKVMGAPQATATMSRDHTEVSRLTAELRDLRARLTQTQADGSLAADLQRVLYGLYTLVKVHFAKEEEVYLPLLEEHLPADEAETMFTAMHEAATKERTAEQALHQRPSGNATVMPASGRPRSGGSPGSGRPPGPITLACQPPGRATNLGCREPRHARSGHTSVRSLARYARVSAEALTRHQAERGPAQRR